VRCFFVNSEIEQIGTIYNQITFAPKLSVKNYIDSIKILNYSFLIAVKKFRILTTGVGD